MRKTRGRPRKKGEGDADTPLFPGFKPKPEGLSGEQVIHLYFKMG